MAHIVRRLSVSGVAPAFAGALFLWLCALVLPVLAQTPKDAEAITFEIDIIKVQIGHAVTVDGKQIVVAIEVDTKREGFVNT